MENRNHCMSIEQAKLIVNAHKHNLLNSFCNNGYVYVRQHENNNNKISQKSKRERETEYSAQRNVCDSMCVIVVSVGN